MYINNHMKCQPKINQTDLSFSPDSLFLSITSKWNQVKWYTHVTPACMMRWEQMSEVQRYPWLHSEVKVACDS